MIKDITLTFTRTDLIEMHKNIPLEAITVNSFKFSHSIDNTVISEATIIIFMDDNGDNYFLKNKYGIVGIVRKHTPSKNANESAFPWTAKYPLGPNDNLQEGLTKRELFASNAPQNVPLWFQHTAPILRKLPKPKIWSDYSDKDPFKEDMRKWHTEERFVDLPEEVAFYQKEWEAYEKSENHWNFLNHQERFFQWRLFYADEMLRKLDKK